MLKNKETRPEEIEELKQEVVKKVEPKQVFEVVAKLPVQEIRRYKREDGTIVNLLTIEEALTEIANGGASDVRDE
jgi:hypothetical protein